MLLRPLRRTFVIMGYKFNNRELLEVTDIKILNLSFVSKGTHHKLKPEIFPILYFMYHSTNQIASTSFTESGMV